MTSRIRSEIMNIMINPSIMHYHGTVMLCSSSSSRNAPRTPKSLSIWSIHQLRDVLISESRMSRTRKQLMQSVVFHLTRRTPRPCVWTPALLRIQSGMLMVLGSDLCQSSVWRGSLKHHDKQSDVKDLSQTGRKTTLACFYFDKHYLPFLKLLNSHFSWIWKWFIIFIIWSKCLDCFYILLAIRSETGQNKNR